MPAILLVIRYAFYWLMARSAYLRGGSRNANPTTDQSLSEPNSDVEYGQTRRSAGAGDSCEAGPLLSGVLQLVPESAVATIPWSHGELNHREFLRQLGRFSPRLAEQLHQYGPNAFRPFTISPIVGRVTSFRGGLALERRPYYIRFTALNILGNDAVRTLMNNVTEWKISNTRFAVTESFDSPDQHPWALQTNWSNFSQAAISAARQMPRRIVIRFHSPTAFVLSGSTTSQNAIHFPDMRRMFSSLRRKMVEFCDFSEMPPPADILANFVELGRFEIKTQRLVFDLHHMARTGFVGQIELLLHRNAPRDIVAWIHLLTRYVFFAGVGNGTVWGMGQARVEPHHVFISSLPQFEIECATEILSEQEHNSTVVFAPF